jgi:hypothetical protein
MLAAMTHLLHLIAGLGTAALGALFAAGLIAEVHRAPDQP